MANPIDELASELVLDEQELLDSIAPEDFVFIVGPSGKLKMISFPDDEEAEVCERMHEIFKFFTDSIDESVGQTLH